MLADSIPPEFKVSGRQPLKRSRCFYNQQMRCLAQLGDLDRPIQGKIPAQTMLDTHPVDDRSGEWNRGIPQ